MKFKWHAAKVSEKITHHVCAIGKVRVGLVCEANGRFIWSISLAYVNSHTPTGEKPTLTKAQRAVEREAEDWFEEVGLI
jgi:hypothetical protein